MDKGQCKHKRKRGARSVFTKKKNSERFKQQATKENLASPSLPHVTPRTTLVPKVCISSPPLSTIILPSFSMVPISPSNNTSMPTGCVSSPSLSANLVASFSVNPPSFPPTMQGTSLEVASSSAPTHFPTVPQLQHTPYPPFLPMTGIQPSSSARESISSPSSSSANGSISILSGISSSQSLPDEHWNKMVYENETQYYKLERAANGVCSVTTSVIIQSDNSWKVFVWSKVVPASCPVLASFPTCILPSSDLVVELVRAVHRAVICPGNPDEKFVSMCEKKGGKFRGERGHGDVVAFIDDVAVIDTDGRRYSCSIRRVDCDIICDCEVNGLSPMRCKQCKSYRNTLRSSLSRQVKDVKNKTAANSHACYYHLTSSEKDLRLHNLHHSLKISSQHVSALKMKITQLIEDHSLPLHGTDASDISSVISDVTPLVERDFPLHSPQRIFWDQQMLYNSLKDKRQMRWHPYVIRFALNLKYLSTSAYKATRLSGAINLPSERTLADYTHWSKPHYGIQLEYIEEFKRLLCDVKCEQHQCVLAMDEMKIKSGLVFDKHQGTLIGFTDLGTVNRDIEFIMKEDRPNAIEEELADQVFVFLVRAVFKPSLSLSIAHYPTLNLRGDQIFPVAWEVMEALEMYDIPVISLTSDGAKPNRRFYRMCRGKDRKLPYKCSNPYSSSNTELYFFCDTPHLLKTARNCFSNSFAHSQSRKMQKNGQDISWKWIEHLFLSENTTDTPGVRMCHKLTRDHVWLNSFTRMRVYLAAQIMSQSVACGLEALHRDGTQETRIFIRMIDKFFDCLNVRSYLSGTLKRNDNILPYKSSSDERFEWLRVKFLSYLSEWQDEAKVLSGSRKEKQKYCLSKETLEGMRITVHSFTELGPKLLQLPGVSYLLSEVFSQDPLERYFSKQRHRGGSNDNPTAYQVPYNASTLVQQKSVFRDLKTMNVEPSDPADHLNDIDRPLKKRKGNRSNSNDD